MAIVSQNGNAYEEGLSEGWNPIRFYWEEPSQQNRDQLRTFLQERTTLFQYTHGETDVSLIAPESYTLDQHFLDRPGNDEIQLDLFGDYKANIALYPHFQQYLRTAQPALLAVWGKQDPFFIPAGAEAFRRDVPGAEIKLIDGGHFLLEAHLDEVMQAVLPFLARSLDTAQGKALFGELNDASVPPAAKEIVASMGDVFGFVPNLGYALAAEPAVLNIYLQMLQALGNTVLDPLAQQVALGAASHANGAEYAVAVHVTLAGKLGASAEVVKSIRQGGPFQDARLEAVRRFAAATVSKHTQVSDSDVKALLSAGFDKRAAVALALVAGAKTLVNTVAHLARPELDPGFQVIGNAGVKLREGSPLPAVESVYPIESGRRISAEQFVHWRRNGGQGSQKCPRPRGGPLTHTTAPRSSSRKPQSGRRPCSTNRRKSDPTADFNAATVSA